MIGTHSALGGVGIQSAPGGISMGGPLMAAPPSPASNGCAAAYAYRNRTPSPSSRADWLHGAGTPSSPPCYPSGQGRTHRTASPSVMRNVGSASPMSPQASTRNVGAASPSPMPPTRSVGFATPLSPSSSMRNIGGGAPLSPTSTSSVRSVGSNNLPPMGSGSYSLPSAGSGSFTPGMDWGGQTPPAPQRPVSSGRFPVAGQGAARQRHLWSAPAMRPRGKLGARPAVNPPGASTPDGPARESTPTGRDGTRPSVQASGASTPKGASTPRCQDGTRPALPPSSPVSPKTVQGGSTSMGSSHGIGYLLSAASASSVGSTSAGTTHGSGYLLSSSRSSSITSKQPGSSHGTGYLLSKRIDNVPKRADSRGSTKVAGSRLADSPSTGSTAVDSPTNVNRMPSDGRSPKNVPGSPTVLGRPGDSPKLVRKKTRELKTSSRWAESPKAGSRPVASPFGASSNKPGEDPVAAECRRIFSKIDIDGDGDISMFELMAAMRSYPEVAAFVLPGVDCSDLMGDEDSFDAVTAMFATLAKRKQRASLADFIDHFCRAQLSVTNMDEMKDMFGRIDTNGSGAISKLELLGAVRKDPAVAAFVRPGIDGFSVWKDENSFDAIGETFASIADGKKRASFHDFAQYFSRTITEVPRPPCGAIHRDQIRVFIIGTGFGAKINPKQSQILVDAGYQLQFLHELPNPEQPDFPVTQYLGKLQAALYEFQPHVVMCASKGGPYLFALWQSGLWTGPSVVLNAHPTLTALPKDLRIVLAHGSNDEVYLHRNRESLESLVATGSPNMCFLYYTADSGVQSNGTVTKKGDTHNMASLLEYDCLPRLIDAAVSHGESPELAMVRSCRDRLSDERLDAEAWLGYVPEQLRQLWASHGHRGRDARVLFEVPRGSEEFAKVHAVVTANPKEPAVYSAVSRHLAEWPYLRVLRIDRVENGQQIEGSARPYFESLRAKLEEQDVRFEPGVHTRWLFHSANDLESIVSNPIAGFQPLASQASLWGSGTYFARDAKYIADGTQYRKARDGSVQMQMLMCLAMTGVPCLGNPQHKGLLPMRQPPHRYDSTVDSLSSPEIFVVQHPSAVYPAYVITLVA